MLSCAVQHERGHDVERHPGASSCVEPLVGRSIAARQRQVDAIDRWSIPQRSCDAKCMEQHPSEWWCAARHPNVSSCAEPDRSDSHVELHRSESSYAEHNRYGSMCEARSTEPVQSSQDSSFPSQPTECTMNFEALLYSLKQNCERRMLPLSPVPCSDISRKAKSVPKQLIGVSRSKYQDFSSCSDFGLGAVSLFRHRLDFLQFNPTTLIQHASLRADKKVSKHDIH